MTTTMVVAAAVTAAPVMAQLVQDLHGVRGLSVARIRIQPRCAPNA
jgi:hypothetical protein